MTSDENVEKLLSNVGSTKTITFINLPSTSVEKVQSKGIQGDRIIRKCNVHSLIADINDYMETSTTETASKETSDCLKPQCEDNQVSTSDEIEKNSDIIDPELWDTITEYLGDSVNTESSKDPVLPEVIEPIRPVPVYPQNVVAQSSISQVYPPTEVPPVNPLQPRTVVLRTDYTGYFPGYGYFEIHPPEFGRPHPEIRWQCDNPPICASYIEYPPHRPEIVNMVRERAVRIGNMRLAHILKTYLEVTTNALEIGGLLKDLPGWEQFTKSCCLYGEYYECPHGDHFCVKCYHTKIKGEAKFRTVHNIIPRSKLIYFGCSSCLVPLHRVRDLMCCPDCLLTFGHNAVQAVTYTSL